MNYSTENSTAVEDTPTGETWQRFGGDTDPIMPWHKVVGCESWDTREVLRALDAGVILYRAPDSEGVRQHNRAARQKWETEEPQRQAAWREYSKNVSGDRLQSYAIGTLDGVINDLSAMAADSGRNHRLNAKAYKLGAYVNVGRLDRNIIEDRLIGACHANGLWDDDGERQCRATIASGLDSAESAAIVPAIPRDRVRTQPSQKTQSLSDSTPVTLDDAHQVFRRWFGDDYDTDALDAMLAAVAVERFNDESDLVWLLLVSGSGNAKTETVQALRGIDAAVVSCISSDAALLSATPKRSRSANATGGLLRKIGERGVLVIKDVTSILSMDRNLREKVLAALREIYDGYWVRDTGTDGGMHMEWSGRIAVIGAVTTAWDTAHSVVAKMGDRFVLIRIDSTINRQAAGRKAIRNTGSETKMRQQLADAAAGVIAGMNHEPDELTDNEAETLMIAADLVCNARTAVEYDYRGDVIDAHAPEMPTRFAKQLAQIMRGATAIGMEPKAALKLAMRCARDSMPPLRLAIIEDLAQNPNSSASDVRRRINKPRTTVDRQLQALHMLGIAEVNEYFTGTKTRWLYTLNPDASPNVLKP